MEVQPREEFLVMGSKAPTVEDRRRSSEGVGEHELVEGGIGGRGSVRPRNIGVQALQRVN